ncbi:MAG: iron chelate uptake ABC transporter family permease subunit [Candidatus Dadabacteria bacterium]|nr:iron chelate uptake ABC transporter family permease subunit [Candidatus Dadabacteria bacterium]NIQ14993.1 iron chelate uptake ABC transporter family permease subunit [Candidatus Dadabacteria bacterium]
MFQILIEIFSDYTIRTIILGASILGVISGTISSYAVIRKQSLLGDVMSHAALPGIALAFIITGVKEQLPILIGAAIAAIIATLLIRLITNYSRVKTDSAMGMILSVFFGFGLVLLTHIQKMPDVSQAGLNKFLFGQAAALLEKDVLIMGVLGVCILTLVVLFWKEFKLLCFDPDFGKTMGFSMKYIDVVLMVLLVASIVIGLQTVGVVLMSSMLIAPAVASRQWTRHLSTMIIFSAIIGAVSGVVGAVVSINFSNIPTGPAIVVTVSMIVFFSLLFSPNGFITMKIINLKNRTEIRTNYILSGLYELARQHDDPQHPHSEKLLALISDKKLNISKTLNSLEKSGYVRKVSDDEWSLTEVGYEVAKKVRNVSIGNSV